MKKCKDCKRHFAVVDRNGRCFRCYMRHVRANVSADGADPGFLRWLKEWKE